MAESRDIRARLSCGFEQCRTFLDSYAFPVNGQCNILFHRHTSLFYKYRVKAARSLAAAAFYALATVYFMRLFHFAGYRAYRAFFAAQRAPAAFVRVYMIAYKLRAFSGGTAVFFYVSFVFAAKISERGENGIWGCLSQPSFI